jgi:hypothetical protein
VAHTQDQRSAKSLCGAKKRNADVCRAFAGQGTDHPGTGRCKFHGGSTPSHRSNAVAIEAKRQMVKLGAPIPDIEPHVALLGVLRATAGHVAWLNREVAGLEDLSSHESRVIVQLYDNERDRLARYAKACSDVGVNEHEIKIQQREAAMFATAVDEACIALSMPVAQRRELHTKIAEALTNAESMSSAPVQEFGGLFTS